MKTDYYRLLNVERNAAADEIQTAYRRLVLKYCPDGQNESNELMQEIEEAYGVLGDDDKRLQYNRLLDEGFAYEPDCDDNTQDDYCWENDSMDEENTDQSEPAKSDNDSIMKYIMRLLKSAAWGIALTFVLCSIFPSISNVWRRFILIGIAYIAWDMYLPEKKIIEKQ
jgi:curved DNA-binding protein CbpA